MPQSGTSAIQSTEKPITTSSSKPGVIQADPVEFPITTVIIPIVVGLVAIILVVLGSSMVWVRIKRSGRASNSEAGRSSSIDDEEKSKTEALKTISNITTSSVDEDEHAISLQHWTSKKAVSNRYESWHIGEIDQEWVSLPQTWITHLVFHCHIVRDQRNKNQTEDGWEVPRHRLHVISILGEGCFGQVWKCQAQNIGGKFLFFPRVAGRHASDNERYIWLVFCQPQALRVHHSLPSKR